MKGSAIDGRYSLDIPSETEVSHSLDDYLAADGTSRADG